jgi:hypothetical protein
MGHVSIASYLTQMRLIGFHVTINTGEGGFFYFSSHQKEELCIQHVLRFQKQFCSEKCCNFSIIILVGILFIQENLSYLNCLTMVKFQTDRRHRPMRSNKSLTKYTPITMSTEWG